MAYRIDFKPSAEHDLKNIPKPEQKRIARKISALAEEPRPRGAKKLKHKAEIWRIIAGDYRILYQVRDQDSVVVMARIRHRREVYRNL